MNMKRIFWPTEGPEKRLLPSSRCRSRRENKVKNTVIDNQNERRIDFERKEQKNHNFLSFSANTELLDNLSDRTFQAFASNVTVIKQQKAHTHTGSDRETRVCVQIVNEFVLWFI